MTLTHLTNQLVGLLCQKDTISAADFGGIKVAKDVEDRKEPLIRAALALLVEAGMLKPAGEDLWILVAPINAAGQEVHLSMPLCNEIASVINTDLEAKEVEDRVDALNIHEGHIMALLAIIDEILNTDPDAD
jgi:hypothetical protein